ncbi:MFS transporter [Serratia fonticola]|uniref:MFS transporter n=1 Tax=Serratia fonticola TaxID=47917 RepID=UPI0003AC6916|nr:MFS transporter [Serratia fonticola]ERK15607.1 Permeases of the major facilitator superfamily [Serratia fonticola AU-P3(3)]MEB7885103.1 MFS transporter [Serratia fonticola]
MATAITPTMHKALPWIAAVAYFMQALDTSILNTALPKMAADLHESPLSMESAVICYALSLALFIPASGFLADKFGTRNVFIFALTFFSIGSLCSASATSLFWLDVSRVLQGVGGAMMVPVSRLTLIKSFDRKDFLKALNTSTLLGLAGPFLGPVLGGFLVENLTWHWIFLINVPIGILGIIFSLKFMPNIRGKSTDLDVKGLVLVSLAFIITTLSLEMMSDGAGIHYPILLFIPGVLLLYVYVTHARKNLKVFHKSSIFPLELFKVKTFSIGLAGNFASRLGAQAIPFLLPLMLQLALGFSAIHSGLMLIPLALAAMIMKELVTPILRRFGYRNVLIYSTFFVGMAIMTLGFFDQNTPIYFLAINLFLIGFVNSLRFTAMSSLTLADLYDEKASSGNSLMSVSQQLSTTFGVAISAVLLRMFQAPADSMHLDLVDSFRVTFVILGVITIISGFIFFKLSEQDGANLTARHNEE